MRRPPFCCCCMAPGAMKTTCLSLAAGLNPEAALLSPRGKVLENGMPRFFRRLAEGVFDLADLERRTGELAQFISASRSQYGLPENKIIAVGYSNGANIAASLALSHPGILSAAILFRAMVPFRPAVSPQLEDLRLFLSAGRLDPIVPTANTLELKTIFETAGADVSLHWHSGGHQLGADDIEAALQWLNGWLPGSGGSLSR